MKLGVLVIGFVVVDAIPNELNQHAYLFAQKQVDLDRAIVKQGWTRGGNYYHAPDGWKDVSYIVPPRNEFAGYTNAFMVISPNRRGEQLVVTGNEHEARRVLENAGWKKIGGVWVKK